MKLGQSLRVLAAVIVLGMPGTAIAGQKKMSLRGYEVTYDDARWFGGRSGGYKALKCKPSICPSIQTIAFMPAETIGKLDYSKMKLTGAEKKELLDRVARKPSLKGDISVNDIAVSVRGQSATLTIDTSFQLGTYVYPAVLKVYMSEGKSIGVIGVSRSHATSVSLANKALGMIRRH